MPLNKLEPELWQTLLAPRLGASLPSVMVGPGPGHDAAVLEVNSEYVLAMATAPFNVVPDFGWERAAWLSLHGVVGNVCVTGIRPQWVTAMLTLPPTLHGEHLARFWSAFAGECQKLDLAIVGGDTIHSRQASYPTIGALTVTGMGLRSRYVAPAFVRPGDSLVLTKGIGLAAAALYALSFPEQVTRELGEDVTNRAQQLFWQLSVVNDALTAATIGLRDEGVSAMHDLTSGGLIGGLHDLAAAAGAGISIDRAQIYVDEDVRSICEMLGIDPFAAASNGALLLTCRPHKAQSIVNALHDQRIAATIIGDVVSNGTGVSAWEAGRQKPLPRPARDPFWDAYTQASLKSDV